MRPAWCTKATDAPDLSGVTDMTNMFSGASSFNGDISGWDVSRVTDMDGMFLSATAFNGNVSGWNVSSVTKMNSMFYTATAFNGNVSGWDVSRVTDMSDMFHLATAFNGNVSGWDVSRVTDMSDMFSFAAAFNGNVSGWDVSRVIGMNNMFHRATDFNQDVSGWNVSQVDDMEGMFDLATAFNQNLGEWHVVLNNTSVDLADSTTIGTISPQNAWLANQSGAYGIGTGHDSGLFRIDGASLKVKENTDYTARTDYAVNITSTYPWGENNHLLVDVTVSNSSHVPRPFVTTWNIMFPGETIVIMLGGTHEYTVDWGDGIIDAPLTGIHAHTYTSSGNYSVAISGDSGSITLDRGTSDPERILSIDQWGDIKWDTMANMFREASNMAYNATDAPDLSLGPGMANMFRDADSFDGNLSSWDVSQVTNMNNMFNGADSFDGDLSGWDVSSVTNMNNMFNGAAMFNGDLSGWNVSKVKLMPAMFRGADSFDGNLSGWNVSGATNMANMFRDADSFDGNLSGWNLSSVTNMNSMFRDADSFDGNLSGWNVSGATNMAFMFNNAAMFNGDLSGWNVSRAINMANMFLDAAMFNGDLSGWDVSSVRNMDSMFSGAAKFNGNISGWDTSSVTNMGAMFFNAAKFNGNISGWNVSSVTDMGSMFAQATSFRQNLGKWFVVPADGFYDNAEASLNVTTVAAQNQYLNGRTFIYGIGDGHNSDSFNMTGSTLFFKSAPSAQAYKVNVTATGSFIFGTNNHRILDITVDGNVPNMPPMLDSIDPQSVNELASLTFTAVATDADIGDALEFSLAGAPPDGASINSTTGAFSWTPTELQDGTHDITVQVSDGSATDSETVSVTVSEVNEDPELGAIGSKSVNELASLTFTATATDDDVIGGAADTLEFSLAGTYPAGVSIDQNTGAFSWTPTELQDGTHAITVQVSDGSATDSETVSVTVSEVNEDPELGAIGSKSVNELASLTFTATATDDDVIGGAADTLEFSLAGTYPAGAAINSTTGAFSWTPTELQDGTHAITVQVSDGSATDSETVSVTVSEVNEDPELDPIGPKSVNELATLSFTASASDDDVIGGAADTLEFSLAGTPPVGASINSTTGAFSWTPAANQTGTSTITVQVRDGAGATDSEDIVVTVGALNANPMLEPIGSKSVNELASLTFTAVATDADIGDALEFSLAGAPPDGASINSTTGAFSWTPTELQDGTHDITVQVSDGSATDSETVSVTVSEVNEDPELGAIGSKSVNELASLTFTATATDDDVIGGAADTLEFSLAGTYPAGVSIDQNTGAFSWTPTELQDGTHDITVQVSDGSATDSETVSVTVSEVNEDPELGAIGSKSVNELASLTFTATATDDDVIGGAADTLEFSLAGTYPAGVSIDQNTGAFSWTPTELQDGTHDITVQVSDGSATDSETVSVTVSEVNEDPELDPIGPKSVNELASLTFTATATDDDVIGGAADTLEFSLAGTYPAGVSIDQNTGAFSWTPTELQDGTHAITVQVSDGSATDSETVSVTVSEVNEDPELDPIGPKSVNELATLSFTASASDDDVIGGAADTLEFSLAGTPPVGASINSTTGAFSWTPAANQTGTSTITVQVRDGAGATDSEDIVVTVGALNANPMLEPIGSKSVNELASLTFTAVATDADIGDALEFSLAGAPPDGASINSTTGAFSWTPTELQDGTHDITVQVSDGSATDSETVSVTVSEVNEDPELGAIGSKSVNELASLTFTATATDDDVIGGAADTLEFSLAGTYPAGAAINSTTGAFSWTPTELQDGTHAITVQVSDGSATDSETVSVTVSEVNEDPELDPIGPKSVNELATLSFTASASDDDVIGGAADTLEFSLAGTPPDGASINSTTGAFSWTPAANQTGTSTITVQVRDGAGATDSEDIVVTVGALNANPMLEPIGSKSVNELASLTFTAVATDADIGDALEFLLAGTPPDGASINSTTGAFSWTPTELQDGTHAITVQVSDGSATDSETVSVTVSEVNEDPELGAIGSKSVNELASLTFTATATDDDVIGGAADTLTFSLAGTYPAGASIDQNTGAFSWTPTELQDGTHAITVQVSDGSATDSETVSVTVSEVNEDPELDPIGPKSVNELATLSFTASASDDDVIGGAADTLEFSLAGTYPAGASIDQNTGAFSWTPAANQTGTSTITVQVRDGAGAADSEDVTVTVVTVAGNGNAPPSITIQGANPFSITTGDTYSDPGTTCTDDTDGSLTVDTDASGVDTQAAGTYQVTYTCTDSSGSEATAIRTVIVTAAPNRPPVAHAGADSPVSEGVTATLNGTGSYDPDGDDDDLTYSWVQVSGPGVTLSGGNSSMATFVSPRIPDDARLEFELTVTDGFASASDRVTITVLDDSNDPPVLDTIGNKEIDELESLEFTATATDMDGNELAFSIQGDRPRGAAMARDGAFSWTPDQSQDGRYVLNVTVSDGDGGTAFEEVAVTVNDLPPLPVSARASSSSGITLALSEAVTLSGAGPNGFSISARGDPVSVESVTGNGTASLTLSANGTVPRGATLSYNSTLGGVADETGKPLASFTDLAVSFPSQSRSSAQPPVIVESSVSTDVDPEPGRPLQAVRADGAQAFPLVIDGNGYALHSGVSTLVPTIVTAGQPVTITVTLHDPTRIAYFAVYLDLRGNEISHLQSDAQVIWDRGGVRVIDPNGLMHNVTMTVSEDPDDPDTKTATLTVTFSEGMQDTNMVIRTWNSAGQITEVRLFGALTVALMVDPEPGAGEVDPEPQEVPVDPEPEPEPEPDPEPDPEPAPDTTGRDLLAIRMWSGFEPESITDAQLLASLGLDYPGADIPDWVMTELGPLVVKGGVTVGEFMTALEYVLERA